MSTKNSMHTAESFTHKHEDHNISIEKKNCPDDDTKDHVCSVKILNFIVNWK